MDHALSNKWWELVFRVVKDLDEGNVPYASMLQLHFLYMVLKILKWMI